MRKNLNHSTDLLHQWRTIVDELLASTGTTLQDVCEYIGATYNQDGPAFYIKLPRSRRVYIGIGMAFRQPVSVINDWIQKFAGKRKLYAKDISEDLIWLYLINANYGEEAPEENLFQAYEEYQSIAFAVFREVWEEQMLTTEDTAHIDVCLGQSELPATYDGLKLFVVQHKDAFKSAYAKPRAFLRQYVDQILTTLREHPERRPPTSINGLRGFLDDSMINYLSGDIRTVHVIDRKSGRRSIRIKHIPKGKRQHISLGLAVGMSLPELDEYLDLMGYAPLEDDRNEEADLKEHLAVWEKKHPLQRAYKNKYFGGDQTVQLTSDEEYEAASDMLLMRTLLQEAYRKEWKQFPYLKH